MTLKTIREQLHQHIDNLPDDIVQQIADFTLFVMARRRISLDYTDWNDEQWQAFALEQLFSEEDEVEYSLEDAHADFFPCIPGSSRF